MHSMQGGYLDKGTKHYCVQFKQHLCKSIHFIAAQKYTDKALMQIEKLKSMFYKKKDFL